jgi:hypothetical protein
MRLAQSVELTISSQCIIPSETETVYTQLKNNETR